MKALVIILMIAVAVLAYLLWDTRQEMNAFHKTEIQTLTEHYGTMMDLQNNMSLLRQDVSGLKTWTGKAADFVNGEREARLRDAQTLTQKYNTMNNILTRAAMSRRKEQKIDAE